MHVISSKDEFFTRNENDTGTMLRLTRFARSLNMTMTNERHPEQATLRYATLTQ